MMNTHDGITVLKVDASARSDASETRALTDLITQRIKAAEPGARIVERDVAKGLEFVDEEWVGANTTPEADRTDAQRTRLSLSDALIGEMFEADILVIGAPIYNFGIPAALKAWVDLVARARKTFRYTESGPEGLLKGKKAYIAMASGGTGFGSEIDFASGYLRHVLGFIGIEDVTFFASDRLVAEGEASRAKSRAAIDAALAHDTAAA